MSPRSALNSSEPLRRKLRRNLVHSDLGENQNVRRVVQYRAPPGVQRHRALHEAVAQGLRRRGRLVPLLAGIIACHMKSITVELFEPAFDRNFPIRVLFEESAADTKPDRLTRRGRIWKIRCLVSGSHDLADQRTVGGLKCAIVKAL